MLVAVFGSQVMFICKCMFTSSAHGNAADGYGTDDTVRADEYQLLLAERLLAKKGDDFSAGNTTYSSHV